MRFLRTSGRIYSPMFSTTKREQILAKLAGACRDLEDVVEQSVPAARYDPVVVPERLRTELTVLRDKLARTIRKLEEEG